VTIEGQPDCCTLTDPFTLCWKPNGDPWLWCPICGAEYRIKLEQVKPGRTEPMHLDGIRQDDT